MPFFRERNLSNVGCGFSEPGNKSLLLAQHSLHDSERTRSHHRRHDFSASAAYGFCPRLGIFDLNSPEWHWDALFLLNLSIERKIYIFTWISISVHNLFCWIILSNKNKWKRGILHCLCVHQLAVEQKRQVINISLLNTANKNKHLKPQMKRLHPHSCHKFNP